MTGLRALESQPAPGGLELRRVPGAVAAVATLAFFFWTAPAALPLMLGSLLLATAVPAGPQRHLFLAVAAAKLYLVATVALLAELLFGGSVIPGQPDQLWYIETARAIAVAVARDGVWIDYDPYVGLHNKLYNMLLGWITYANGGESHSVFRLFNVFASLALVVYGRKIAAMLYPEEERLQRWAVVGLGLLPALNIFSMMVLRDVLISLSLMMFFYYMMRGSYVRLALVLVLTYYLRLQLALLLVVIGLGWLLVRNRTGWVRWSRRRRIAVAAAGMLVIAAAAYGATQLIPILAYLVNFLGPAFLAEFAVAFPVSFLGLDFLFSGSAIVGRAQLLLVRMITPETIILPILFLASIWKRPLRDPPAVYSNLTLVTWAFLLIYAFGYYVEYGEIFVRLLLPIYPLILLLVLPHLAAVVDRLPLVGAGTRTQRAW